MELEVNPRSKTIIKGSSSNCPMKYGACIIKMRLEISLLLRRGGMNHHVLFVFLSPLAFPFWEGGNLTGRSVTILNLKAYSLIPTTNLS